ncbi:hypothetical protein [Pseudovibrio sp. Tun.PSC04-5.I4]|uniref:hypothetical protein n=1 Tax=Pseudovibrio sp. Tun.PSC04-5.I4 TaxID=1798213 RepID=UPI000889425D|nr:hypothetical protein [Pseudovibrio sp. Tun.PSC04-5.I4]SDR19702.1 hypothetical protein SAMN04515695_3336 [Pseudovibrio sp. Tun.PSC04-5.I4]
MAIILWGILGLFAALYVLIGLTIADYIFDNCRIDGKSITVSFAFAGMAMVGWPVLIVYLSKKGFW